MLTRSQRKNARSFVGNDCFPLAVGTANSRKLEGARGFLFFDKQGTFLESIRASNPLYRTIPLKNPRKAKKARVRKSKKRAQFSEVAARVRRSNTLKILIKASVFLKSEAKAPIYYKEFIKFLKE